MPVSDKESSVNSTPAVAAAAKAHETAPLVLSCGDREQREGADGGRQGLGVR